MKHPGIYLHTDPADPASPLWMLHWSSLTLAKLVIETDRVLHVARPTIPPDAAVKAFAAVLEEIEPGMTEGLTMRVSTTADPGIINPLFMAPADPSVHGFAAIDPSTGLAIGALEGQGIIGPIWNVRPLDLRRRDTAIHTLATFAYQEIQRAAEPGSFLLEILPGSPYFPGLWIHSPDLIARSAVPASC